MPNLKIIMPKPCNKGWQNMGPSEQGRFCNSCQTEVIDFTKLSTTELTDYFKYPKGNICGRMSQKQLIDLMPAPSQKGNISYLSYKFLVASCLTLLTSTESYSKEGFKNENIYQDEVKYRKLSNPVKQTDTLITVSGVVRDSKDGSPLPGVVIFTKDKQSFATTDIDGKFKIHVKFNADQKVILVSSCIGYETTETEVSSADSQDLQIKLPNFRLLEEVRLVGMVKARRPLTNRIGYFFKRIFEGRH